MPRSDGRLEPGQPIRGAISARAWNRAQDAADLVLGARAGVEAGVGIPTQSRLVANVRVFGSGGFPPGSAIYLTGAQAKRIGSQSESGSLTTPYSGSLRVEFLTGFLTTLNNVTSSPIGISINGSGTFDSSGTTVVPCVISGLAVVRVRLFSDTHRFAVAPFRKGNEQSGASKYTGILDSSPCACESSMRVIAYDVASPPSTIAPGDAPIAWATVIV